jgi:excinuclease UvrABC nuclease subunit
MPKPLVYRPPYTAGKPSAWLAGLGDRSGVYVIRDARSRRCLYVGESHSGRLRKTLLRHFQKWSGRTAGPTYAPDKVEVALRLTPPPSAVAAQDNLICRLDPRDNDIKSRCPDDDATPF